MDKLRIESINDEIIKLKKERQAIKKSLLIKKLRMKKNKQHNGISNGNQIIRVSNNFSKKLDNINEKREENGLDQLSNPKITDLIISHKLYWLNIEKDILSYIGANEEKQNA